MLDMRLPDGSGLDLLNEIKRDNADKVAVLAMSAYGEIEDAVSAMKLGALDYLKNQLILMNCWSVLKKYWNGRN